MNKEDKEIIRGHVTRHESQVDNTEIWSQFQNQVKKEERKPKWYLFFFSLGVILLLSNFIYFNHTANVAEVKENNSLKEVKEGKDEFKLNKQNDLILASESNNALSDNLNQQTADENLHESGLNSEENVNAPIEENQNSINEKNLVAGAQNKTKDEARGSQGIIRNKTQTEQPERVVEEIYTASNLHEVEIQSVSQKPNDESFLKVREKITTVQSEQIAPVESFLKFDVSERPKLIDVLDLSLKPLAHFNRRRDFVDGERLNMVKLKKKGASLKSISVVAGVGFFKKQMIALNQGHESYVAEREKYEVPLEQFSVQTLLTVPIYKKINISSGLDYLVLNEEFNWSGNYYVNQNGEIISSETFTSYLQKINHNLKNYNQTKILSMPILLGISSRYKRIIYDVKAGVNLKLNSNIEGQSLNLNLIPQGLMSFNRELGMGFQSKVNLGYLILPNLQVLADFSLSQWSVTEDLISEKIQSFNVGLGIRKTY